MSKNIIKKDAIIIGAGPAGISCGLILKENNIDFAILDGSTPGGKINIAPRVDNYPGFTEVPGPDLAFAFFERLINAGISIEGENVLSLTKDEDTFILDCDYNIYHAKTVLIATGTEERKLGIAKEDEMFGKGLSYCAICDGHFFKDKNAVIIGGGNSALKEAIYLAGLVKKLYIVHRRNEFRGSKKNLDEVLSFPNVEIVTPYVPKEILGEDHVTGLVIENRETHELRTLDIEGMFPLVGQNPNTQFVKIPGVLDDYKAVPANKKLHTKVEGLFAAGDVLPRVIKQIYLSEFDGKVAAKEMINFLKNK